MATEISRQDKDMSLNKDLMMPPGKLSDDSVLAVSDITLEEIPYSQGSSGQRQSPKANNQESLRILIASWNVGNAMPPKEISPWIPLGGGNFDIVAVGLQESNYKEKDRDEKESAVIGIEEIHQEVFDITEAQFKIESTLDSEDRICLDSSPVLSSFSQSGSYIADLKPNDGINDSGGQDVIIKRPRSHKSYRKVKRIVRKVSENIRESVSEVFDYPFSKQLHQQLGEQYILANKVELMEMRLFLFVHEKHTVTAFEKVSIPTGLGSVLGNKGGLILKCVISNTSLCFVSCHLAAHQDQKFLEKRNADCAAILGAHVGKKHVSLDHQFDYCFWFGDLNYRIDLHHAPSNDATDAVELKNLIPVKNGMPDGASRSLSHEAHFKRVLELVHARKWGILNENDQLKHQMDLKRALSGWQLPLAYFAPTFKRVRNAESEYNDQRVPSYCDRILYTSLPGYREKIQLDYFSSIESLRTSDHKPVHAAFTIIPTNPLLINTRLSIADMSQIDIADLSARNLLAMDITGTSDPYIKFGTVPKKALQIDSTGSHPVTAIRKATLYPSWKNHQIPKLRVLANNREEISKIHLVFVFLDHDATSMDDVLGTFVLNLADVSTAKPHFQCFGGEIYLHGRAAGSINGKIRITLPSKLDKAQEGFIPIPRMQMTKCACHIT